MNLNTDSSQARAGTATIRPARSEDVEALLDLEASSFGGVYADHRWSARQFAYYLKHRSALVAIAEGDEGQALGYVAGIISSRGAVRKALLYSIAVLPAARRRGIARHLLRWFVERSRRAKCQKVVLEVSVRRRSARRLFEQEGFEPAAPLSDYYGTGEDGLQLSRRLVGSGEND